MDGTQPSPNFRDGYLNTLVADAVLRSAEAEAWAEVAASIIA